MYKCPRCKSKKIETAIINEVGYIYCNNCGYRTQVNDQDGGGPTTTQSPGIEFVVPPGSSEHDIQLFKTLNEISTQHNEDSRYDADAHKAYKEALYGPQTTTQSATSTPTTKSSGGGKRKKKRQTKSKNKKKRTRKRKITSKKKKRKNRKLHRK